MKWAHCVLPLAVLAGTASLALHGCGSTGASAGDGGASADGTTRAPDAPDEVAAADAPVDGPIAEASIEASVEAGDAEGDAEGADRVRTRVALKSSNVPLTASPL